MLEKITNVLSPIVDKIVEYISGVIIQYPYETIMWLVIIFAIMWFLNEYLTKDNGGQE